MSRPQRVRVPWRLVASYHYGDPAVSVYVKVAALGLRPEGCTASVAYLAGLLGISRSGAERSLTQLMRPAPDDDVVELTSHRRTMPGGTGTTAVRRVRVTDPRREHGAWVPTRAAEGLSPRQLRLYAALSYAVATSHDVTLAELGEVLRHRSGARAGQPLDDRSVDRLLRKLEGLGWITVHRRAGYRGRHLYLVHDEPLQAPLTPDPDDGSGAGTGEGSLAYREDRGTDSPDDERAGGSIRRRRATGSGPGPADDSAVPPSFAGRHPYRGPELSLAPRIWQVLEPVHVLMGGLSPYVVRRLAREVGRQLDQGVEPERLRQRLEFRFASTDTIRDPGRWLIGAAVVRHGCGLVDCESGVIWRTGTRCQVCADRPPPRPTGPERPPYPRPGYPGPPRWHECDSCGAPARQPLPEGLCLSCHPAPSRSTT